MPQTHTNLGSKLFLHWETWTALLATFLIAFACFDVGVAYGHRIIGLVVGILTANLVARWAWRYVAQRYYPTPVDH